MTGNQQMLAEMIKYLLSNSFILAVLAFVAYIMRDSIIKYFEARISRAKDEQLQLKQHQFEKDLNGLKSAFDERQLRHDRLLASLSDVSSERAKALSLKEIQAAEAIWKAVGALNSMLVAAKTADMLKFDVIAESSRSDKEKFKQIAGAYTNSFTPEAMEQTHCERAQLFVNEKSWAIFSAYRMIILSNNLKMKSLAMGLDKQDFFDKSVLRSAILDALPHQKPTLEKHPDIGSTIFLEELSRALLLELRKSTRGEQSSATEAARAQAILDSLPNSSLDLEVAKPA